MTTDQRRKDQANTKNNIILQWIWVDLALLTSISIFKWCHNLFPLKISPCRNLIFKIKASTFNLQEIQREEILGIITKEGIEGTITIKMGIFKWDETIIDTSMVLGDPNSSLIIFRNNSRIPRTIIAITTTTNQVLIFQNSSLANNNNRFQNKWRKNHLQRILVKRMWKRSKVDGRNSCSWIRTFNGLFWVNFYIQKWLNTARLRKYVQRLQVCYWIST